MRTLSIILLIIGVISGICLIRFLLQVPPEPEPVATWFGQGSEITTQDSAIQEFKVHIPKDVLQDLNSRLDNARFTDGFAKDFSYGFRPDYLKQILDYWRHEYNWTVWEKELNKLSHYTTKIYGLNVHFIRMIPVKPIDSGDRPVLFLHGWPSSIWEFFHLIFKIIYELRGNQIEIICPSIPGFGFSEQPHQPGFNPVAAAHLFQTLMKRLGHDQYYIQGGDWGSIIATVMAQLYPDNVIGIHLNNFVPPLTNPVAVFHQMAAYAFPSLLLSKDDQQHLKPLPETVALLLRESGYFHIQATKPDTLGFALNDSPLGLAAYILEKVSTWTNTTYVNLPDGGLDKHFSLDELLTQVMIYWSTGTIGSSTRMYKEAATSRALFDLDSEPVLVPTALASFPGDLMVIPLVFSNYKYRNIIQTTYMPRGGHFPAWEEPLLLAEDLISFIEKVEKFIKE